MKITSWKLFKYTYISFIILWVLTTIYIVYVYADTSSEETPVRGGTFVHGTVGNIGYLPYIGNSGEEKFFQNFLFDGCKEPYVDGTQIEFEENLCSIETDNYREFEITVKNGKEWLDGEEVNIDDIYFTYKNIIKENKRDIGHLQPYQDLEIDKNQEEEKLTITFPNSSRDNEIFFHNYILPQHYLSGSNLQEYTENFGVQPVGTSCGNLQQDITDPNSIMFDLSNCENSYIRYYQVISFESFDELKQYSETTEIIDTYINYENLAGFEENQIILNNFASMFYNIDSEKLNSNIRQALTNLLREKIYEKDYQDYFIEDRFIFDIDLPEHNISELLEDKKQEITQPQEEEIKLDTLPNNLTGGQSGGEFYLEEFDDFFNLSFELDQSYDEISIQANEDNEYFLTEYDQGNTADYNISEQYQNIQTGENNYIVRGYEDDDSNILYDITVHYQEQPVRETEAEYDELEIDIIYYKDEINDFLAEKIKEILQEEEIAKFFNFREYEDAGNFDGSLQTKNYDIIIRGIEMGLRDDISNIFLSSTPSINPSGYVNSNIASNISQYFTTEDNRTEILENIHEEFKEEVPFVLFGKKYGSINIEESIGINYPERMYSYLFMKEHLNEIILSYRPELKMDTLFDFDNFIEFINESIENN